MAIPAIHLEAGFRVACLLKAPEGSSKGCVTFTTPERDLLIAPSPAARARVEALKQRYVLGLHHNWHDYKFRYDQLFDFSMAGDGDLIEATGRDFPRIPMDACNFAPSAYSAPRGAPFWDILYVARAVNFKGIPEFFQTIRALYDVGRTPRVLFICAAPEKVEISGIADLRKHFETLFSPSERQRITFLTINWDYPFPLDAETLAFFYHSSRIFFHSAPDERRCRTAAYAWAGKMPVACGGSVASILPQQLQRAPFLYVFHKPEERMLALAAALDAVDLPDTAWSDVAAEFSAEASAARFSNFVDRFAALYGWGPISRVAINTNKLDIRLGRHHDLSVGANRVELSVTRFCEAILTLSDAEICAANLAEDPEEAIRDIFLRNQHKPAGSPATPTPIRPPKTNFFRKLFRA